MGERCSNDKALLDYGICHDFIKQVVLPTLHLLFIAAQRWSGAALWEMAAKYELGAPR